MSETKSLAAPKASFDRRTVVKTAAWSVPVIAAAIAAPAAAASHHTVTVTAGFANNPAALTVTGTPEVQGTGPKGFTISTTGPAISGTASAGISIVPFDQATRDSKIGLVIGTINGTAVTAGQWSGVVAVPAGGTTSPALTLGSYSRTGTGQLALNAELKYVVTLTIAVLDSATNKSTILDSIQTFATLKKK